MGERKSFRFSSQVKLAEVEGVEPKKPSGQLEGRREGEMADAGRGWAGEERAEGGSE